MKSRFTLIIVLFIGILAALAMPAGAQRSEDVEKLRRHNEQNRQNQAAIDDALLRSVTAVAIHKSTGDERIRLLSEAVRTRDLSVIPYLRALIKANWDGLFDVDVTLVKLGEMDIFDKIVRDTRSDVPRDRYTAIAKLAQIKSKDSYRKLYELLDDESFPKGRVDGDSILQSTSALVMDQLSITVANPPKGSDRFDKNAWKAWFEKNRHLID